MVKDFRKMERQIVKEKGSIKRLRSKIKTLKKKKEPIKRIPSKIILKNLMTRRERTLNKIIESRGAPPFEKERARRILEIK